MSHSKKIVELFLFGLGIFLFAIVIRSVGLSHLWQILLSLQARAWFVFLIYPFMCAFDVQAWRLVFPREWYVKLPYGQAFLIRLTGEAMNNVTPVLDVGGEPLKVILAWHRLRIPKVVALSSVVLSRTALFIAEILFILFGVGLSFSYLALPHEWEWGFLISVISFILFIVFFIAAQQKGMFLSLVHVAHKLKVDASILAQLKISFEQVDENISFFYTNDKKRFVSAVLLHLLGWFSGGVEMMVLFWISGVPVSLLEGILLESLLQLVRISSFFIPGNLGAQEASLGFLVQIMGYHPALGVAVSLLKRVRQMIWTAVGFALWGSFHRAR